LPSNNSDFGLSTNNSDFGLEDAGRKYLSGHYSNLKFGIVDFVIPSGRFAAKNLCFQSTLRQFQNYSGIC
jgi:hypothetical protein